MAIYCSYCKTVLHSDSSCPYLMVERAVKEAKGLVLTARIDLELMEDNLKPRETL